MSGQVCKSRKLTLKEAICGARGMQVLITLLGATYIVLGGVYFNDCPGYQMITVFMVVYGVVCLVRIPAFIYAVINRKKSMDKQLCGPIVCCVDGIFMLLQFGWQIYGTIVIARADPIHDDVKNSTYYCDKILFDVAKGSLFFLWVFPMIIVILIYLGITGDLETEEQPMYHLNEP